MRLPERALSLRQPWAELIVSGRKTIETRSWNTSFRGAFLIHASKAINGEWCERLGVDAASVPRGCVVGVASIVEVREYASQAAWDADAEAHLAGPWPGKVMHGYVLSDVQRVRPVACRGMLNFFVVDEVVREEIKRKESVVQS